MTKPVPRHIRDRCGSAHAFRSAKREQIRAVEREVKRLTSGCAYLPEDGFERVKEISEHIAELKRMCRVKEWGE